MSLFISVSKESTPMEKNSPILKHWCSSCAWQIPFSPGFLDQKRTSIQFPQGCMDCVLLATLELWSAVIKLCSTCLILLKFVNFYPYYLLFKASALFTPLSTIFAPIYFQVLAKSCKPIPVLVFGAVFAGKKYSWRKYVFILMIVVGVAMFLYKDKKTTTERQIGIGELLLVSTWVSLYSSF